MQEEKYSSLRDREFVDLYTKLYNENFTELEALRKDEAKSVTLIILYIIIGVILSIILPFLGIIFFIVGIVLFIVKSFNKSSVKVVHSSQTSKNTTEDYSNNQENGKILSDKKDEVVKKTYKKVVSYKELFKEKIIPPIINLTFPNNEYKPYSGISELEYNRASWERYDLYDSEDMIVAEIDVNSKEEIKCNFVMSEVHTKEEHEDDEGHKSYTTVFWGFAGSADLPKDIACSLNVIQNRIKLFGRGKNGIEMDMSEFEKIFDVECDDKIKAMQLLTSDVMTDLINMVEISKVPFEFKIVNSKMYIRFHTGGLFETNIFGKAMQYDALKKYFNILEMVKKTIIDICNNILETEL